MASIIVDSFQVAMPNGPLALQPLTVQVTQQVLDFTLADGRAVQVYQGAPTYTILAQNGYPDVSVDADRNANVFTVRLPNGNNLTARRIYFP